jgi:nanoRNase/pAp phosphatase (c-di-AMP/oligoRNAs hydrolase)
MKQKIEKINQFLEEIQDSAKHINIVVHSAPDPDAVGSALGMKLLFDSQGYDTTIYYSGDISHPQNKTIVNILSIPIIKYNGENLEDDVTICVDCTENNSIAKSPSLVVDHHRLDSKAKYKIIDSSYGANATLVWEILKEFGVDTSVENSFVFTALLLGIRTDTNDLVSEQMSKSDFIAYQELLELSDKDALQKAMNYPLPRYLYERRIALHEEGNSQEANGVFVGGIGFIPADQRDVIAILAEEYTRMESVQTAVIFAITGKKHLEVSVRTHLVSLDVNQMCRDLFGEFGGGKSNAGAAKIPLNFYEELDDKSSIPFWNVTKKHMFKKVLKENWSYNEEVE